MNHWISPYFPGNCWNFETEFWNQSGGILGVNSDLRHDLEFSAELTKNVSAVYVTIQQEMFPGDFVYCDDR